MLKRYWLIAAGIGLAAIVFSGYLAFREIEAYGLKQNLEREEVAASKSAAQAEHLTVCLRGASTSVAARECVSEAANAQGDDKATQYDLNAQHDMARWAHAQLLVSLFGTAVSILGLGALFASLRQTGKAIKDTREIGEAQVRAYMACVDSHYGITETHLIASVVVRNFGTSPCPRCHVTGRAYFTDPKTRLAVFSRPKSMSIFAVPPNTKGKTVLAFDEHDFDSDVIRKWYRDNKEAPAIKIELDWLDVFGVKNHATNFLVGSSWQEVPRKVGNGSDRVGNLEPWGAPNDDGGEHAAPAPPESPAGQHKSF